MLCHSRHPCQCCISRSAWAPRAATLTARPRRKGCLGVSLASAIPMPVTNLSVTFLAALLGVAVSCGGSRDSAQQGSGGGGDQVATGGVSMTAGSGGDTATGTSGSGGDSATGTGGVGGSGNAGTSGTGGAAGPDAAAAGGAGSRPDASTKEDATSSKDGSLDSVRPDAPSVMGSCTIGGAECPAGYECGCGGPGPVGKCECHKQCESPSDCSAPNSLCGCASAGPKICVSACFCFCG